MQPTSHSPAPPTSPGDILTAYTVPDGGRTCTMNNHDLPAGTLAFVDGDGWVICAQCAAHCTSCTDLACDHPRYAYAGYPSIDVFYDERPERRTSGEVGYGVHWHAVGPWPLWRVSYIRATGEVYAVEQHAKCRVQVLGIVAPDPVEDRHTDSYYATLDQIFTGWAEPDISGHDLAWIRQRLAAAAEG